MKIVVVSIYPERNHTHGNTGGVASYTKNLVSNLPRQQSDEIFVLCNKISDKREFYSEETVNVIRCFDRNFRFVWQIWKEIQRIQPDVIHIQQELALYGNVMTAYLLQWLIFSLRKYNTIITLHGVVSLKSVTTKFIHENNSKLPVWITKIGLWMIFKPLCIWAKQVIVHEELFRSILIEEYYVKPEKISVVFHGVENLQAISKETACRELNIISKRDIVLFMGYLTGYKGLDLLIEGFSLYAKINPNAYLILGAGKHPKLFEDEMYLREYQRIQDKAKQLISEQQYRWVGFIDEKDIVCYYSVGDVSIYPYTVSMSSSGPMAIAIGYEKPFLASDVFKNIIPDAILFERNAQSIADKLNEFFENKSMFLDKIKNMKSLRIWNSVGVETIKVYKR